MADIRIIPDNNKLDPMIKAVHKMQNRLPAMLEYFKIMAKLQKIRYDQLIIEGFNEEQALELCKNLYSE